MSMVREMTASAGAASSPIAPTWTLLNAMRCSMRPQAIDLSKKFGINQNRY